MTETKKPFGGIPVFGGFKDKLENLFQKGPSKKKEKPLENEDTENIENKPNDENQSQISFLIKQKQTQLDDGFYSFIVTKNEKQYAMSISEASEKEGAYIVLEPYSRKQNQQFYLYFDREDGCYVIISYYSNQCHRNIVIQVFC